MKPFERWLGAAALGLGVLATIAGSPRVESNARMDVAALAGMVQREEDHVNALELARWIRDAQPGLRVVDVRDSAAFTEYHIPGAERIPLELLVSAPFRKDETIVLYSDGGAHAAQGWVFLRGLGHDRVYFLRGGLYEWLDDVMNPTLPDNAPDSARDRFAKTAELSRYFGGVPRVGEPISTPPVVPAARGEDHEHGPRPAVARVRGRGC